MSFIEDIKTRVKSNNKKTIILTEGYDSRVLKAIEYILKEDLADIILLGKPSYFIPGLKIVIPEESNLLDKFTTELYNLRKHKGVTIEKAKELLVTNYMYFACMLLRYNLADAVVSGVSHTSLSTFKPALELLNTSSLLASSFMIMDIEDKEYIFSDIALNRNPNPNELACIAIDSSLSYKKIFNKESFTALLSYSTFNSGKGEDVEKVKEAVKIAKNLRNDLFIDGEMQVDAALDTDVAIKKGSHSPVSGKANVLIFPDLNSGNIGYKLVNRFTNARAYGPFMQGLTKTVSDLSRGATTEEIIETILITCIQTV